jgi:hypothetical protein
VLLCCKGCAGFVVNATAIIPQTDEALRILLAISFRVRNRLLNIDFRLRWCVNGSHLSLCAVARFEVQEKRMDTVQPTRHEPQHPVAPTLQTRQAWSVSKKYTLASRARHPQGLDHNEWSCLALSITATSSNSIGHMVAAAQKRRPPRCFPQAASFSAWFLSLVRLSVLDSLIVQVVLGRTVIGTAYHRLHTDILHLRDQT